MLDRADLWPYCRLVKPVIDRHDPALHAHAHDYVEKLCNSGSANPSRVHAGLAGRPNTTDFRFESVKLQSYSEHWVRYEFATRTILTPKPQNPVLYDIHYNSKKFP